MLSSNRHHFIIQSIFIVFFLFAAYVQLNDVDSALWVGLYIASALAMCAHYVLPVPRLIYPAFCLVTMVWAAVVAWASLNSDGITQIEERREAGGLLLCTVALAWMYRSRMSADDQAH